MRAVFRQSAASVDSAKNSQSATIAAVNAAPASASSRCEATHRFEATAKLVFRRIALAVGVIRSR